jgi:hypothetical protein
MRLKQLSTIWQAALLAEALQDGQRKLIPEFGMPTLRIPPFDGV